MKLKLMGIKINVMDENSLVSGSVRLVFKVVVKENSPLES
jgi:hypothetical protein